MTDARREARSAKVVVVITPRMAEIHQRMMAAWNAVGRREPEKIRKEKVDDFHKHAMDDLNYLMSKLGFGIE